MSMPTEDELLSGGKSHEAFNQGGPYPIIVLRNLAKTPLGIGMMNMRDALQVAVDRYFMPVWSFGAHINVIGPHDKVKDAWEIVFLDDADEASALGYHDLTKDGLPISKVFVKDSLAQGPISVTTSHELFEMLIDPGIQMWAEAKDGSFYAYEMCDAVEELVFLVNGIQISDFVYPAFFESFRRSHSVQFDFMNKVAKPFQTLPGGYQIRSVKGKIDEVFGSEGKRLAFKRESRRGHRSEYRKDRLHGETL